MPTILTDRLQDQKAEIVYFAHGGGPLPLLGEASHTELIEFLKRLPEQLITPKAILVISAHWEEECPTVTSSPDPGLYYDYYGFPPQTYNLDYPVKGAPKLAEEIAAALQSAGLNAHQDSARGLDHGVFIPLLLMYPEANIACLQISLLKSLNPADHIRLGEALRPLLGQDLLILGSGASYHNLPAFRKADTAADDLANSQFEGWLRALLSDEQLSEDERRAQLCDWEQAPAARACHPREEHLLPLLVCYGLAGRAAEQTVEISFLRKKASTYLWSSKR